MVTRTQKGQSLCCVSIDFLDFVMTVDEGTRLMKLMQNVTGVKQDYLNGCFYVREAEPPKIEMKMIKASQVVDKLERPTLLLDED